MPPEHARPFGPAPDCVRCPRLAAFRAANAAAFPDWHNAPVPAFGPLSARLLIVGLAPGRRGANRTGRPFTGDFAGHLLYGTLAEFGFARGRFEARADDGVHLVDCRITNALRCVPPKNRPTAAEMAACRDFLADELAAMPNLRVVVALGTLAHRSVLATLGVAQRAAPFTHGAMHAIDAMDGLLLADSYHCSRYNTNTGRLTEPMFRAVFEAVRRHLDGACGCGAPDPPRAAASRPTPSRA